MDIEQLLSKVDEIETISDTREYWLIRTQSGKFYEKFLEHDFIAIDHEKLTLKSLYDLRKKFPQEKDLKDELKTHLESIYNDDEFNSSLAASQIIKFVYHIKKNDIIVIPSSGSAKLSFGIVTDTKLPEVSETEKTITECDYSKRKKVKWIKTIPKERLDPYLYKMLVSHQAITNANSYSQEIERSLSNFFIKNGEGNLVLSVHKTEDIGAFPLFETGYLLLNQLRDFAKENRIEIDLESIDLKTYLNSPGKIHLKSPKSSTVFLLAVLIIGLGGGGLKIEKWGLDLSTNGIIQKVIDYQNNNHDRNTKDAILRNFKELKIEEPDDAIKLLQQLSENKNLPK